MDLARQKADELRHTAAETVGSVTHDMKRPTEA
jgi:hypothetical protein